MSIANARTILGFDLGTILTIEVITKRYRELIKQYHPDKHVGLSETKLKEYNQKTSDINNAYDYLKQHIDRLNKTTKSNDFDMDDDVIFFTRKARAMSNLRKYFKGTNESKLKNDVVNLYNKCNIENATNSEELRRALDMFYGLITVTYKNEETRYRLANKIPNSFKYDLDYNTDVDTFLTRLNGMKKARNVYINNALDKIVSNNLCDEDYSFSKSFLELREYYKSILENSNLTSDEEREIFRAFKIKVKGISNYFEKHRQEYLALVRSVRKIDKSFVSDEENRDLIELIDSSIINKSFTSTKMKIEKRINEYKSIKSTITKLKLTLTAKYKGLLLVLNPDKDKDKIYSAINTYEKLIKLLNRAKTGEFSAGNLKVLENISFTDEDKDKILLSMVTDDEYNIFISYPNDAVSIRYEPFILGNLGTDNFISLGSDSVSVKTKEEVSKDTLLLPLNVFVKNGNVVNLSRRTKKTKENILCQYGGYELVLSQDLISNDTFYFLRPSQYKYESYGDREMLLNVLESDISNRFLYYTDRMQKKGIREPKIRTNREEKE